MLLEEGYFILGITNNGNTFRPSDWAERIATVFGSFDDCQRLRYNPLVTPARLEEQTCLFVASRLAIGDPAGYGFIMEFAAGNRLEIRNTAERHL